MEDALKSLGDPAVDVLRQRDDAWLKILYAEVWKQYVHEDALTQARTTIFQVMPVVLLAFLGVASTGLAKIGCATFSGKTVILGITLVGAIFLLVSVLMFLLASAFEKVTDAGRLHVNLRHMNARALERLAGVGVLGPALLEHHMRDFKPSAAGKRFRPYSSIPELSSFADLSSGAYSRFGGFAYLSHITKLWRIVFALVLVLGLLLMAIGLFGPALDLGKLVPAIACV